MRRLLRLHYGTAFALRDAAVPPAIHDPIAAYFAGDLGAIDGLAVCTNGTAFQREVWAALRHIPAGTTLSYGALAHVSAGPRRYGRWGSPTAPTRSASWCRATG